MLCINTDINVCAIFIFISKKYFQLHTCIYEYKVWSYLICISWNSTTWKWLVLMEWASASFCTIHFHIMHMAIFNDMAKALKKYLIEWFIVRDREMERESEDGWMDRERSFSNAWLSVIIKFLIESLISQKRYHDLIAFFGLEVLHDGTKLMYCKICFLLVIS